LKFIQGSGHGSDSLRTDVSEEERKDGIDNFNKAMGAAMALLEPIQNFNGPLEEARMSLVANGGDKNTIAGHIIAMQKQKLSLLMILNMKLREAGKARKPITTAKGLAANQKFWDTV
jgi:hypothetical protein